MAASPQLRNEPTTDRSLDDPVAICVSLDGERVKTAMDELPIEHRRTSFKHMPSAGMAQQYKRRYDHVVPWSASGEGGSQADVRVIADVLAPLFVHVLLRAPASVHFWRAPSARQVFVGLFGRGSLAVRDYIGSLGSIGVELAWLLGPAYFAGLLLRLFGDVVCEVSLRRQASASAFLHDDVVVCEGKTVPGLLTE